MTYVDPSSQAQGPKLGTGIQLSAQQRRRRSVYYNTPAPAQGQGHAQDQDNASSHGGITSDTATAAATPTVSSGAVGGVAGVPQPQQQPGPEVGSEVVGGGQPAGAAPSIRPEPKRRPPPPRRHNDPVVQRWIERELQVRMCGWPVAGTCMEHVSLPMLHVWWGRVRGWGTCIPFQAIN